MGATASQALAELRDRYVELLIAGDARGAHAVVAEALRAAPAAAVYRGLVTEALHEVGDRWERGEATVAEEHLATGICESSLPDLAERLPRRPRRRRTAIVACAPWELHALGARVVADFLDAGGWDVLHLGALVPASVVTQLAVARDADVVALSATTTRNRGELEGVCERLHALPRSPFVAAGGQALLEAPETLALGGAIVEQSPEALVELLAERFPADEPADGPPG